jgi:hypothetical protein
MTMTEIRNGSRAARATRGSVQLACKFVLFGNPKRVGRTNGSASLISLVYLAGILTYLEIHVKPSRDVVAGRVVSHVALTLGCFFFVPFP